ncbi:MAG: hypothetical protein GY696_08785 [Gammaproteobacteria bacterium]|nr:hypothetical protein [Gammaproteobacteria bacterium]
MKLLKLHSAYNKAGAKEAVFRTTLWLHPQKYGKRRCSVLIETEWALFEKDYF